MITPDIHEFIFLLTKVSLFMCLKYSTKEYRRIRVFCISSIRSDYGTEFENGSFKSFV